MSGSHAAGYPPCVPDRRKSQAHWRVGPEQVIVVSNGLTASELSAIERAMGQQANTKRSR